MKRALLVAFALLALAACKKSGAGAKVDPALSTLVPPDATLLVGIRVEDLMKAPLYQKYLADRTLGPLEEFKAETGVNIKKDLWEILFISTGKDNVVLGRGKFSNEAEPRIARESQGGQRMSYRGFTLIGDEKTAVLLMGPSLIGMGDTAALRRIVDTRDKTNGPPAVLANRMKDIPGEAEMWAVFRGTPITLPPNAPPNMGNLVKTMNSVESGSFYLDFNTGISGKASGSAATDPAAKELYDSLRGMLGLVRLMGGKNDVKQQRLYDGLRVTQDGRNVNLYIEEQEDSIATLMDLVMGVANTRGRSDAPTPLR
ncbi:MAG: hypothetical protein WDO18_02850 [Acidobacteriota bacterium]